MVRRIRLTNVRCQSTLEVELGPGLTILVGPNGVGKTTVLEALALVLAGAALRPGAPQDLIMHSRDYLRIEADLKDEGVLQTAAAAYSRDGTRRLTVDGAPLEDWSRWRDVVPLRTFIPDDLRLIKGGPKRRRDYLDTLAARYEPGYRAELSRYDEALTQRNALLRMPRRARTLPEERDDLEFAPWESILASTGLRVSRTRAATLATFVALFQRVHAELTGDSPDSLRLLYRTNVAGLDEGEYRERLAATREQDRRRTFTQLGPHRDDLRLIRGGIDIREHASQGEQRAALLTLVLAEWEYAASGGRPPLLLLDDVMSELDQARRDALVAFVGRGGQVIITTTDLRYFSSDDLEQAEIIDLTCTRDAPTMRQ